MAPNQRADNKKMVGIYVDAKLVQRFQKACEHFGITMSAIITAYMEEKANEYEQSLRNRKGGNPGNSQKQN